MAGWSHVKRVKVEKAFYDYLNRAFVYSKDKGRICLGEHLFAGQRRLITEIFDALENDIHEIYVLKSRQLGISTIIRFLSAFLIGINPGLKGAIVFDTDFNKIAARNELEVAIKELPASLKFPKVKKNNRQGLILHNDSEILFMSAGVRVSKTSGGLGRSVGLALAHCSELCSWADSAGLEAFRNSLSDINPDRLYIYESTARGFNMWNDMWKEARADPLAQALHLPGLVVEGLAADRPRAPRLRDLRRPVPDRDRAEEDHRGQAEVRHHDHAGAAGVGAPRLRPDGASADNDTRRSNTKRRPTASRSSRGPRTRRSSSPARSSSRRRS
jgi:hypothetical protein